MYPRFFDSSSFFDSTSIAFKKSKRCIDITQETTLSAIVQMCPDDYGMLPEIHIWGGANLDVVKRIPIYFDRVTLRDGVDETESASLPIHIKMTEIFYGVKPRGIMQIAPSVESIIYTGATEEMIKSTPARYYQIGFRADITPSTMAATPPSVRFINILGPISATTLKYTPPTIKCVYFCSASFVSFSIVDEKRKQINPGFLLLNSLPDYIKGVGVLGEMSVNFLKCLTPKFQYLHVVNNYDNLEFAKAIPFFISRVLVTPHHSEMFIESVPYTCEVRSEKSTPQSRLDFIAARNERRLLQNHFLVEDSCEEEPPLKKFKK